MQTLTVLDAFFFAGPAGVVGLVIYDNGYAVKATTAPVAPVVYAGLTTAEAEALDTKYVLTMGAPFPLAGALAMSGAARAAHAKYEPPRPPADPPTMGQWAGFRPPADEAPPWTYNDLTAFELSPGGPVGACGCNREASADCWRNAEAATTPPACHWRALGWVPYRSDRPADPPTPGAIELHSFTDINLGDATPPAPCNCTPGENQHCYFVRPRGLPGCVHVAERRAATRRDPPPPAEDRTDV